MPRLAVVLALLALSCNPCRVLARREWKEELDRKRNRELIEYHQRHGHGGWW